MSEYAAFKRTGTLPATVESLADELAALGVVEGAILLVHASLMHVRTSLWRGGRGDRSSEEGGRNSGTIVMLVNSGDLFDPNSLVQSTDTAPLVASHP